MNIPPTHLVIVCCHGIWLGGAAGHDEAEWLIAGFQRGETATFIEHVRAGVDVVAGDEGAVLCFSGGPTRKETRLSEAASYLALAHANGFLSTDPHSNSQPPFSSRILLEERALDSFQNMLFSLTLFQRTFGGWPKRISIVSHAFKRRRIVDLHIGAALRFPLDRVEYVGIDPPGLVLDSDGKSETARGTRVAEGEWAEDLYGLGEGLAGKRRRRNPWGVGQGVFADEVGGSRGGLVVKIGGDGVEMVDHEAQRPWEVSWSSPPLCGGD